MLNLHFPDKSMRNSKKAVAIIHTPEGIKIHLVKIIYTKFFLIKNHGIFEIDQTKGIRYGKTTLYFYDSRSAKPMDFNVMKELDDFAYNNKLNRIRRKDVRHGDKLRHIIDTGVKLKEGVILLKEYVEKKQKRINNTIDEVVSMSGKGVENIDETEQGFIIVESLIRAKLIPKEEAEVLQDDLRHGKVSLVDMIERLRESEKVDIHTPISMNAQRFLNDYHTYSPSEVDVFIDRAESLGGKMRKLGSPEIKNTIKAGMIFAIIVGGALAVLIITSINFENVIPGSLNLPGMPDMDIPSPSDPVPIEEVIEEEVSTTVEEVPIEGSEVDIEEVETETITPPSVNP